MSKKVVTLVLALILLISTTSCLANGHEPQVGDMCPEAEVLEYIQDMTGYVPTVYIMDEDITVFVMTGDWLLRLKSSWDEEGNKNLLMPTVLDAEDWEEMAVLGFSDDIVWDENTRFVSVDSFISYMSNLGFELTWEDFTFKTATHADPFSDIPTIEENEKDYIPEVDACQIIYTLMTENHPWARYQSLSD